jgi:hypothetical protein
MNMVLCQCESEVDHRGGASDQSAALVSWAGEYLMFNGCGKKVASSIKVWLT